MSMVCPQCQALYEQAVLCPNCGVRLRLLARSIVPRPLQAEEPDERWQNTTWGRVAIGVLIAQGLAHGMKLACTAALMAVGEEAGNSVWRTPVGGTVLLCLQAVALLLGGALAAAGRRYGAFLGLVTGLLSGGLFLVLQRTSGDLTAEATTVGVATVVGVIGGWLGGFIWKPLPYLQPAGGTGDKTTRPTLLKRASKSALAGPVSWGRVVVGAAIAACGVFWPGVVVGLLLDASMGSLRLQSPLQAHLITWEVAGLLVLLGGAVGGATTRNPFKHGLFVGLTAIALLVGNEFANRTLIVDHTLMMASGMLLLCLLGSLFGAQVFPPIAQVRRTSTY